MDDVFGGSCLSLETTTAIASELQPVAIIGISCRFPGARNVQEFWQLLCEGRDAISDIPSTRFPVDHYYDERPGVPGKIITRRGGFIDQVDQFDAAFFHIPPQEAACMDPQHRILLEVAWEACEDAGLLFSATQAVNAGVFLGIQSNDHEDLLFRDTTAIGAYSALNNARSTAAGRISYFLNLRGPALAIDTACSSSLTAVHLACQSIRNGECALALAGGSNLILEPEQTISSSQGGMLSPDGRCHFGDARANGFVRSEGIGIIVLKPLAQALADHDPIYAIIRGSAINNDGNFPDEERRLAKPSVHGQSELLQLAYAQTGIDPSQVTYIEAHGTGTSVGDPVEFQALAAVLATHHTPEQPCYIGSVKTNIGHTEGAAGIAGLIKMALCLKYKTIVPTLHFHDPNPAIPWQRLPFVLPRTTIPWSNTTHPRYAGVSAFGISGTNVHVILQEPPAYPCPDATTDASFPCLLPLSAHSPEALTAQAQSYLAFLRENTHEPLSHICYSASLHRTHHNYRLAFVGQNHAEIALQLQTQLQHAQPPAEPSQPPPAPGKCVFVFPGQGSQWIGMGRQLLQQEPVFREALAHCEQAMRPYIDWTLHDALVTPTGAALLERIDVIQPTLFALEVALAALWRSWGIEPQAVIGHSMGEVAAAYVAGALSLDDAARVICLRSRLMRRLSHHQPSQPSQQADQPGAMLFAEISFEQASHLLASYDPAAVSLAASNSPRATVLSGKRSVLAQIAAELEARQVFCRFIKVDVASHSPYMDALKDDLLTSLAGLQPRPAQLPIYSTVLGARSAELAFDASYWVRNLREPVLFSQVVQQLLADEHTIFIEVSPHPILLSSLQQCFAETTQSALALGTLQRDSDEKAALLQSLAALYTQGIAIDWQKLYSSVDISLAAARRIQLPAYPWQRTHFPLPTPSAERSQAAGQQFSTRYPLIQHIGRSALHPEYHFVTTQLSCEAFPYLNDHRIHTMIVLPATAYIEMALETACAALASPTEPAHANPGPQGELRCFALDEIEFAQALTLPETGSQTVQMALAFEGPHQASFQFLSLVPGASGEQQTWNRHARGLLSLSPEVPLPEPAPTLADIQQRCTQTYTAREHYQILRQRKLHYGPAFQGVAQVWKGACEALGRIVATEAVSADATRGYTLHPAWLDACLQVLVEAIPEHIGNQHIARKDRFMPVYIQRLRIYTLPDPATELCWSYAHIQPQMEGERLTGNLFLFNDHGQLLIEISGIQLQRNQRNLLQEYCYLFRWDAEPLPPHRPVTNITKRRVLFSDDSATGQSLAALLAEESEETCTVVTHGERYERLSAHRYQLCTTSTEDMARFLEAFADGAPWEILYLAETRAHTIDSLTELEDVYLSLCEKGLALIQALLHVRPTPLPRLWLVTCGAQPVLADQEQVACIQSPFWGLRRQLINEHPEIDCITVDLSADPSPHELRALIAELEREETDVEIALRGEERYVHHLAQYDGTSQATNNLTLPAPSTDAVEQFALDSMQPGTLDGLQFYARERRRPGPGEVEIHVYASALNFRDVLLALGMLNDQTQGIAMGFECVGKISALGPGVEGLQIGDAVMTITNPALSAYVIADARLVLPKPAHLSFEESATIPGVFSTALYALKFLARLQPGERVLIHSATGGVGLAAVQIAQQIGAEIFATASTPEKHAYLRSLGVKHIMNSRTLDFAAEIMRLTNGVDVILNSLAGAYIQKGLAILRPGGRFLELGKRDIYQENFLPLSPFRKNLSYFAIDLLQFLRQRPLLTRELLLEVQRGIQEGTITPLPSRVFPLNEAVDAFRYMMQARHIGKIVLAHQREETFIRPPVTLTPSAIIRADATYLISGGLGGIGITVARWLVERGARHLVLLGRNAPSPSVAQMIAEMQRAGAQVVVALADVARAEDVRRVLDDIRTQMPPLKGILHAAVVLDDGLLMQLNRERCRTVVRPKVLGAWNLHRETLQTPLDFFVLFSTAATMLAPPGQGNYIMANAFLDALAHHRRALGLPALCTNWGPWGEVGVLAARPQLSKHFEDRGAENIDPQLGVEILGLLLSQSVTQVGIWSVSWQQWQNFYPAHCSSSLLRDLIRESQPASINPQHTVDHKQSPLVQLRQQDPAQQQRWLEGYLLEQFAEVRGIAPAKLQVQVPLLQQGLDSLMAVELRNRLQRDLNVTLLVKQLLGKATIQQVAEQILQMESARMPASGPAPSPSLDQSEEPPQADDDLAAKIEQLPEGEIDRLLEQFLAPEIDHGGQA